MFPCAPLAVSVLGGSALRPAASLPFPVRRHASFLAGALEGAARLKLGAAAPRRAQPRRRPPVLGLRCAADSTWGSSAASRRHPRSLPASGPRLCRRASSPHPAVSAGSCVSGKQPFSSERIVPSVALHSRSLFEVFPGVLGSFPDSCGTGRRVWGARVAGEPRKPPGLAEPRSEARTYSTSLPPCLSLFDVRFRTCGGYWNRVGGFCS